MTNIMDRMTRMEAEMVAKDEMMEKELETRDASIAVLEAAIETLEGSMETKDRRIAVLEDAMEIRDTQMWELEEEMASLTGRMDVTEETDVLLRGMVDQVRNPPFAFQCAYRGGSGWSADNSVITYDRLTYDDIWRIYLQRDWRHGHQHWSLHSGPGICRCLGYFLQHPVQPKHWPEEPG